MLLFGIKQKKVHVYLNVIAKVNVSPKCKFEGRAMYSVNEKLENGKISLTLGDYMILDMF